jgi:hypothetical protein
MTMRVWNGDHGNRSIRAGMMLRITPGVSVGAAMVASLRTGKEWKSLSLRSAFANLFCSVG